MAVIGRRFLAGVASDAVSATGVAAAGRRAEERRAAGFAGAEAPRILSTSFNALISACRRSISLCRAASRLLGISWVTVGSIVERIVARRLDGARFAKLRRIGVDEFSYRKRHRYLTIVVDHDERRVVWAGRGRSAETLGAFFEQLGPGGCARIELVTADLASSWQKALRAWVPHARVVFDRFHVERLAADAVDEVRRSEQRLASEPEDAKALKGTRYALLKHPARLRPGEARRLETLRRKNRALDRAYELKEYLATILGQATPEDAPALLDEWLEWAARSRLTPFVKLGRTIRKHAEGILAYLDTKMTNGPVEGINNKLRVIARRAYGFHSPGALISLSRSAIAFAMTLIGFFPGGVYRPSLDAFWGSGPSAFQWVRILAQREFSGQTEPASARRRRIPRERVQPRRSLVRRPQQPAAGSATPHPNSASESTNRTKSACREMDCFW